LVAAIPRLRRYARVLTGNPTLADDLVQDTLARAWDKRRLWRAGTDLRAWLFTIMHNVYVNQRARARREAGNVSLDSEGEYGAAWQVAEYGNQFERVQLRELVQQMSHLPAEQREVLLLAAVEELRYEEIAAALAIPIGTVMSRLSRARNKLRRLAV
jgi:RNA polymerase sigma-70 factor (ECF subfamily)